jgi:hypothetical protein
MRHPFFYDAVEMPFVQGDHTVQALAPHRPNDAFTDGIGLWTARWRFQHSQPQIPNVLIEGWGENCISVMDQQAIRMV